MKRNICLISSSLYLVPSNFISLFFDNNFKNFDVRALKKNKNKLGVFNFPIQSGSNKTLRLMRRPYKIESVINTLQKLKIEIPELKFGTHIIFGFPGERKKDFQKSLQLMDKVKFDFIIGFKYSDNTLADSFRMTDKSVDNDRAFFAFINANSE